MDPLLVDVSSHVDRLDWPALVAAGPPWHGAIVKVSEGVGGVAPWQVHLSAWVQRHWPAIRTAAGERYGVDFFRGGYHYLLAGVDGRAQAEHYLQRIEQAGGWDHGDLWPIVDVEEGSGNRNRSKQQVIDSTGAFVEAVRARTGRGVILYAGWWLASIGVSDKLGCSWIWYPSYTATLPARSYERIGWKQDELLAWQYVGDGDGKLEGYPKRSPLGDIDISAVTIAGGGAAALEWLRANVRASWETPPRNLHLTSPALAGADVLDLQTRLAALGYAAGMLDGEYGLETVTAVRAFQRDHALAIDGVVGPITRRALSTATRPAQPSSSPIGLQALAEAMKHLGVQEAPPGSRRTMFGEWFGANGVPWANIFVSYCFAVGAGYALVNDRPGAAAAGVREGKGCAYVPTTEAWLRAAGMWIGRVPPLPGDVAIFSWHGGPPDHIGIVVKDLGGGAFETIEGNTAAGGHAGGGEVRRRVRYLAQTTGLGRITP